MDEIKKKAIAHYDRMIEWAEKQDPKGKAINRKMQEAIGEEWFSDDCSFCQHYHVESIIGCDGCPLFKLQFGCCNGRWDKLSRSKMWKSWIKNAKSVRAYIKKV